MPVRRRSTRPTAGAPLAAKVTRAASNTLRSSGDAGGSAAVAVVVTDADAGASAVVDTADGYVKERERDLVWPF
jgi:hypothetical protein